MEKLKGITMVKAIPGLSRALLGDFVWTTKNMAEKKASFLWSLHVDVYLVLLF